MPVLMHAELLGATAEQVQSIMAPVKEHITSFPGFSAQASGPIPGGYQVTEVWETQEAHERWLREVVGPLLGQLNLTQAPSIQYQPIDDFITR